MKTFLLTRDKNYYRSLVVLAVPVALQNLITFLVTFADNLMVNSLGDGAVSGVYMGSQIQTLLQMFSGGIGGAIVILSAQYWGKKDITSIKKITSVGMRFALVFGGILMVICAIFPEPIIRIFTSDGDVIREGSRYLRIVCFSYPFFCMTQVLISSLRSVESTRIGMYVSAMSLVTNITLNYLLIFGKLGFPEMRIYGAAIATLISRIVETLVIAVYAARIDKHLRLTFKDFLLNDSLLRKDFIRYGLPLVGGEMVWSVNMMANAMILGHYGAGVITAASVANTLNSLAYITINGLASAVGIITGKTIGSGNTDKMKEYARTTQIIFLCLGFITGAMILLLKLPFLSLYKGISAEAANFAGQFIMVLAITSIGTCYQMPCLFGLVKSGGDISFVFKNDTIFVFCVVLPSAILTSCLGAAPWIVFACLKCDQILKCFVAVVKINKYNWMKNLTRS